MRSLGWRGLAACAVIPVALMLLGPAAHAEEPSEGTASATLTERIVEAAEAGIVAPTELAEEVALPVEGGGNLSFDAAARITATVIFAQAPTEAELAAVSALAEIDAELTPFPALTVRVDPAGLGALAEIPGVLSATPALTPFTGTGVGLPGPRSAAATPGGDACGPIPIEADGPLRSAEARQRFGVDGSGVTVGVISDSFGQVAFPTSWEDDVASGALPGPGNPCGRETPVEVLFDGGPGSSDEGRAMAQLVHGIAPGAKILFADAGKNDIEMAQHIVALQEAGADIIVDDISWSQETLFQQGFISGAIEEVKALGVAYFTSAGNSNAVGSNGESSGRPISSWSTTAYRPTACPDWLIDGEDDPLRDATGYDCLDFDPSDAGEVPYDTLHTRGTPGGPDISVTPIGSIGEPLFGVTTEYEWRYYAVDPAAEAPELVGVVPRLGAGYPGAYGAVSVPRGAEIRMVMVRIAHDPAAPAPAVRIGFMRGGDAFADRAHLGDGVTDIVGPSTFGHGADGSALSVASLHWDDTNVVREYSSLGSNTLYFEPVSFVSPVPAAPLPAPVDTPSPHIAAVDGTQTTFFEEDEGGGQNPEYRFYGTSAAAPNAAAVAALALSADLDLEGDALSSMIRATARGTANGGPVNPYAAGGHADSDVFGSGIVDAVALLEEFAPEPAAPNAPTGLRASEVTATSFALGWDPVSDAARIRVELLAATPAAADASDAAAAAPAAAPLVSVELPGTAVSHRFTDLAAETAYVARVSAVNAAGLEAAATLPVRTLAADVTPSPEPDPDGTPKPDEGGAPDGQVVPNAQPALTQTGGNSLPLVVAGGALLLVGAATIAVVASRRAARRRAEAAVTGADAGSGSPGDGLADDARHEAGE